MEFFSKTILDTFHSASQHLSSHSFLTALIHSEYASTSVRNKSTEGILRVRIPRSWRRISDAIFAQSQSVLLPVYLHAELCFRDIEVKNVLADCDLASNAESKDIFADCGPEPFFSNAP